jgi:hypothetical protein
VYLPPKYDQGKTTLDVYVLECTRLLLFFLAARGHDH